MSYRLSPDTWFVKSARAKKHRRRALVRSLRLETLEGRCLMAADFSSSQEFDSSQILVELEPAYVGSILTQGSAQIGQSSWWTIPVQGNVASTVAAFQLMQGVINAMPDYVVELADHTTTYPNDSMFQGKCLWGLDNHTYEGNVCGFTGGVLNADINALDAWAGMNNISTKVVVAVIDTGVDYTHPDLMTNMWTNSGEIAGNRKDDDSNGYVDDVRGWDFVSRGDNDPMDLNGHGTHVAGTIGAIGNNNGASTGIVGVAYNNVQIMPLRVFDAQGRGKSSSVIAAINYAVVNGAKISNNSYTIGGLATVVASATARGHLFIAAAGNSNSSSPQEPASLSPSFDTVISVAASTRSDTYASFTNFGTTVDLAAPGDLIWSTFPLSLDTGDGTREGYRRMSGTSMASPHVVGEAALVWAKNPTLTAAQVKSIILVTTDPILSPGSKTTVTNGRVNAARAVGLALTPPTSTTASATSSGSTNVAHSSLQSDVLAITVVSDASGWAFILALPSSPLHQRADSNLLQYSRSESFDKATTMRSSSIERTVSWPQVILVDEGSQEASSITEHKGNANITDQLLAEWEKLNLFG